VHADSILILWRTNKRGPSPRACRPWVVAMFVQPAARGRGVGNALLRALVQRAGELGFARMYLWTHDQQAWYQRHGWVIASEGRAFGEHAFFLELDVGGALL
jgi:GNAT superfamily N-acetyltransferase